MAAINPNDLAKFSGILEIRSAGTSDAWTRLPSVRALTTTIDDTNIVEVKADDTGTVLKVVDRTANVTLELLENRNRDKLSLLFGWTPVDVAGVLVAWAVQTVSASTVAYGEFIPFDNQNGNGSAVVINSVTGATDWAIVLGTDYNSVVVDWIYGISLIAGGAISTLAQDFTIDTDYTPNSSENLTLDLDTTELANFEVRVTATDSAGKTSITKLTSAILNSTYSIAYADVIEAGDITGSSLTFEANKWSQFVYENEII